MFTENHKERSKKMFLTLFCQVSFILSTHFEKMSHDFEGLGWVYATFNNISVISWQIKCRELHLGTDKIYWKLLLCPTFQISCADNYQFKTNIFLHCFNLDSPIKLLTTSVRRKTFRFTLFGFCKLLIKIHINSSKTISGIHFL